MINSQAAKRKKEKYSRSQNNGGRGRPYSDWFGRVSSYLYQLLMTPFMNPERITKSNTKMLTAVKTLFTVADSLTPNARIPRKKNI